MRPTYNRSRVMRDAHKEWRSTKHKPGVTFAACLRLAWAVEKRRAAGPQYYQPPLPAPHVIAARSASHDYIWL